MKQEACFVYMATSPSGLSYIGVSVDPNRRWLAHKNAAIRGSQLAIHRAIRKYGAESFLHQIVFEAKGENSQAICFRAEKTLIEFHATLHPNGYNLLKGGDTASGYSRVTSEKHRNKIIKALSNPDVRKKMSDRAKAHFSNPAARARTSKSMKAYFESNPEAKAKMSAIARERFDSNRQLQMTEAAKIAMKKPKEAARRSECAKKIANDPAIRAAINAVIAKQVVCVETGNVFKSIADAVRWLQENGNPKAQKSKISQVASGKNKTAYGFVWEYA